MLLQSAADEAEPHLGEVSNPAVEQLRAAARCAGRPVVPLENDDPLAAVRGVECDAGTDDAPADDGEVEVFVESGEMFGASPAVAHVPIVALSGWHPESGPPASDRSWPSE